MIPYSFPFSGFAWIKDTVTLVKVFHFVAFVVKHSSFGANGNDTIIEIVSLSSKIQRL